MKGKSSFNAVFVNVKDYIGKSWVSLHLDEKTGLDKNLGFDTRSPVSGKGGAQEGI